MIRGAALPFCAHLEGIVENAINKVIIILCFIFVSLGLLLFIGKPIYYVVLFVFFQLFFIFLFLQMQLVFQSAPGI